MKEKIRRAVQAALTQNTFTANEAIKVNVQGRVVILTGSVSQEELIYEALATAEAVSSKLKVYASLDVVDTVSDVAKA